MTYPLETSGSTEQGAHLVEIRVREQIQPDVPSDDGFTSGKDGLRHQPKARPGAEP